MKKSIIIALCAVGSLTFLGTGCTSIETNRVGNQVQVKMPVRVQPTIETKDQTISGAATVHCILGIFTWGANAQAVGVNYGLPSTAFGDFASKGEILARNAAAYDAATSAKADIILAPQYVLTVKDYFVYKNINCEVKGFPGVVKGVKVVEGKPAMKIVEE